MRLFKHLRGSAQTIHELKKERKEGREREREREGGRRKRTYRV